MQRFVFLYVTNPSKKAAERLAEHLLKKRLIACANIIASESRYRWKGKLAREREYILIAKTSLLRRAEAVREIEKVHPYEIPCIVELQARANAAYARWIEKETKT